MLCIKGWKALSMLVIDVFLVKTRVFQGFVSLKDPQNDFLSAYIRSQLIILFFFCF